MFGGLSVTVAVLSQKLEPNKCLILRSGAFGEIYLRNIWRHKHLQCIIYQQASVSCKCFILVAMQYQYKKKQAFFDILLWRIKQKKNQSSKMLNEQFDIDGNSFPFLVES